MVALAALLHCCPPPPLPTPLPSAPLRQVPWHGVDLVMHLGSICDMRAALQEAVAFFSTAEVDLLFHTTLVWRPRPL